jgi:hypothetical protein
MAILTNDFLTNAVLTNEFLTNEKTPFRKLRVMLRLVLNFGTKNLKVLPKPNTKNF